ncbi:MAG: MazG nucleotide pyrophosphohydrolase domain-containing protein [Candidatus Paceibacterota bacterium]|jgi:NTP pyrophosphatase (non-canonical NTP hydrolase)
MTFEDIQKFIDEQDKFLRLVKDTTQTERERILSRTVKISEEFGELSDEVLTYLGDQRKGKMENRDEDGLSDEFADVVITTLLLAKIMNVDILHALEKKIEKIKAKHNKQLLS